jgi:LysM repeat protein
MKFSSLSVKRRPVKKGALRTLFANLPRRKVRAATAAAPMPEMDGDVPNLGIARALVVILIIHVVAIAGIFAHSHWFEGPEQKAAIAAKQDVIVPAKPLPDAQASLPKLNADDQTYITTTGDTYDNIAIKHGVTEQELRGANDNLELRAGRILRIPPRTIVAVEPAELTRLREGSVVLEVPVDEIRDAPMVPTAAVTSSTPVLARPNLRPANVIVEEGTPSTTKAPVAIPVAETPAATKKYTVKSGDTFWKIAQSHNTTPAAVMKANKISDPKKLKVGMQLMVP